MSNYVLGYNEPEFLVYIRKLAQEAKDYRMQPRYERSTEPCDCWRYDENCYGHIDKSKPLTIKPPAPYEVWLWEAVKHIENTL